MDRKFEEKKYINWLYHVPGIGRKTMGVILSQGIGVSELYQMSEGQLLSFCKQCCGFAEKKAEKTAGNFAAFRKQVMPEKLMEELYEKQILFLMPDDPEYPEKLKRIPDAPFALYMMGNKEVARRISGKSVAIVGARECSEYGRCVAKQLGECCAALGLAVVSGMAYGVDGVAQYAALKEGATVAAVLGSGVDVCYPPSNQRLYDSLLGNGCVFSEYVPGTEPKSSNFPPRNRIISGMSDALIVVEAREKSGTLITVDMALEQGKDVYVVPGRVSDPMSRGCNRLIKQGAIMVCNVEEALEEIAGCVLQKTETEQGERRRNPYPPNSLRYAIGRAIEMEPKSVQQIFESPVWEEEGVERPVIATLQTELFYMQVEGNVCEAEGRYELV